jgi:hypothetical protein
MSSFPGYEKITKMFGLNLLKVGDRDVVFDDQLFFRHNGAMIPLGTLTQLKERTPIGSSYIVVNGEHYSVGDVRLTNNLFVSNAPKIETFTHVKLGEGDPINLPTRGDFSFIGDVVLRNALTEAYNVISNIHGGWTRTNSADVINAISRINMGEQRRVFDMAIETLGREGWGPFVSMWTRRQDPVETDAKYAHNPNAVHAIPLVHATPLHATHATPLVHATLVHATRPPGGRRRRTNKRGKKSGRKSRNQKRRRSRNRKYKR